jgi:protein-arginine kinase activator protein McsA
MNRSESNYKPYKNTPTAQIVCWHCRKGDVTLLRVLRDGKKTEDYICTVCAREDYAPPIGNMSKIYLKHGK